MNSQIKQYTKFLIARQKCIYAIILFCISVSVSFSQNLTPKNEQDLDSIISKLSKKLNAPSLDSIELYSDLHGALNSSKKSGFKKQLAQSFQNLAVWHQKETAPDSSEFYFKKAAATYHEANLDNLEAESYVQLEDLYKQSGEYNKAMTEDFKALALYEKTNNKNGISKIYTRLCDLLYYQGKYEEGANYCQKAIDIQKELNVPKELAVSYRYKADNLLILKRYDEALKTINLAIKVLKDAGSPDTDLAKNYNTRGNIYKYMKRYDAALAEYKKCYDIAKMYDEQRSLIPALGNIGHVFRLQNQDTKALPYILEAIDVIKKSGNTQNLTENYMQAANVYKSLEQYEKALKYENLFSDARAEELQQIINQLESELQIKYESAKKDETIEAQDATIDRQRKIQLLSIGIAVLLAILLFGMYFTIINIKKKRKVLAELNTKLAQNQKSIESANSNLKISISKLKSAQAQLIQSEKMASLGELTAGIAHEIQNPLNFVNNFAEVSNELIDEMNDGINKEDYDEAKAISMDIKQNLEKIAHHGKRADGIVKGMLQHSRSNTDTKELTDINKLADEYFRLAYHGIRAKNKSFNATLETNFDENLQHVSVIPQEIGRVILNIFTNAFYAVNEKKIEATSKDYKPTVSLSTKETKDDVYIIVSDNGNGIPKSVLDKIFQPFFTTKPTGSGTGLGLSMSYDIITKGHGGELSVETIEGKGATFSVTIPIIN